MKLTIEELKKLPLGEWIYIKVEDGAYPNTDIDTGYYRIIPSCTDDTFWVGTPGYGCTFKYEDYGTKWKAYKNKEQADKPIDVTKKCCDNCRNKGLGSRCEKLNQLFADNGVQYEDGIFPSSNDKWSKRYDIMKENCCDDFDSRWLEYPIAVTEVECRQPKYNDGLWHDMGKLVKIRPCSKEYSNKTYLGFYLGDLPTRIYQSHNGETHKLTISTHGDSAIFVPSLGKIIFGYESWWGEIEKPEDLKDITDECINDQWYVKALKELTKKD